jgi:hypothetical protein
MSNSPDLTGQRFGRLTCIKMIGRDNQYRPIWLCKCDCGKETKVISSRLRREETKSCGCLGREKRAAANTTHSLLIGKRDKAPRLYSIWRNMKQRCFNPKASKYEIYGGRGITVCKEWLEYLNFHNWAIQNGYSDELSIDRIDSDGNYEPSNCRWVSYSEQNSNKRDNHLVTYNGVTKTMKDWSIDLGMKYSTLKCRLTDYKWTVDKAFTTPVGKRRKI